ncbi:MAG: insulinase family protein [Muribaculaceae bacterium]|nr:insulinase family protein [Muribaculaceae bacterium]
MIEYNTFTLSNGLRVVHNYDGATAMVALNVLYNVGARDESPELTGMAHLFEHLMFGGSVNVPEFDSAIENAGGMNNAWTSNDYTNFYDIVPAQNVETAFWVESDRMLSLAFSDKALEVQRHVVIEEFKQTCLNRPYGDMSHYLRAMIYKQHPYRYPVIGKEISHIEKVTQDDVREFFYSHYAPNNAVLAISGRISLDETKRLAQKWFEPIPQRDIAPRKYPQEPRQTEARMQEAKGNVPQLAMVKAYRMPGYGMPDYVECDVITDLLASGHSSRFYRNLLMKTGVFTEIDASIIGSDEPGFLMLNSKLTNNDATAIAQADKLMKEEVQRIIDGDVSEYELTRTINRFESNFMFSSMGFMAKAQSLANYVMHNEDINGVVARYRSITTDDISRVAKNIFDENNCATLIYHPQN